MSSAYETLTRSGLLSPEEVAALSRVEPLAELMYLMMSADNRVTDAERDAMRGAVRGLSNNVLRTGTINVMLESFEESSRAQGRDARLRELAEEICEHESDAEAAFVLAAAIALADDEVADEEDTFINQLASWLGIEPARAETLLDQLEADAKTAE